MINVCAEVRHVIGQSSDQPSSERETHGTLNLLFRFICTHSEPVKINIAANVFCRVIEQAEFISCKY